MNIYIILDDNAHEYFVIAKNENDARETFILTTTSSKIRTCKEFRQPLDGEIIIHPTETKNCDSKCQSIYDAVIKRDETLCYINNIFAKTCNFKKQ